MEWEQGGIYVILGFGTGEEIWELYRKIDNSNNIVVIEPCSEIIYAWARSKQYKRLFLDKRVFIYSASSEKQISNILTDFVKWVNFHEIKYEITKGYEINYLKEIKNFLKAYRDVLVSAYVDRNTILFSAKTWQENLSLNLPHALESLWHMDFKDKFKDMPGILVSAGPSLDKNIEELQNVRGKAVIICCYTALPALLNHAITPDLIISVDSCQTKYDTANIDIDIPLLYSFSSDTKLLNNHKGAKILCLTKFPLGNSIIYDSTKKQFDDIRTGGSVACTAVGFMDFCGFSPIILVGQDFAFTNGYTHAKATCYDGRVMKKTAEDIMIVEGMEGEIYTSKALYSYKLWFDNYFAGLNKRVIDATEGGAIIKNTDIMTLKEALLEIKENNGLRELDNILNKQPFIIGKDRESYISWLLKVRDQMEDIIPEAAPALNACESLFQLYSKEFSGNINKEELLGILDAFDKKFAGMKELKLYLEIPFIIMNFEISILKEADFENQELFIIAKNGLLYKSINSAVVKYLPILKESLEVIEKVYDNAPVQ